MSDAGGPDQRQGVGHDIDVQLDRALRMQVRLQAERTAEQDLFEHQTVERRTAQVSGSVSDMINSSGLSLSISLVL